MQDYQNARKKNPRPLDKIPIKD
jgi:hypothetical protein